jgi:hypothetical protein
VHDDDRRPFPVRLAFEPLDGNRAVCSLHHQILFGGSSSRCGQIEQQHR